MRRCAKSPSTSPRRLGEALSDIACRDAGIVEVHDRRIGSDAVRVEVHTPFVVGAPRVEVAVRVARADTGKVEELRTVLPEGERSIKVLALLEKRLEVNPSTDGEIPLGDRCVVLPGDAVARRRPGEIRSAPAPTRFEVQAAGILVGVERPHGIDGGVTGRARLELEDVPPLIASAEVVGGRDVEPRAVIRRSVGARVVPSERAYSRRPA